MLKRLFALPKLIHEIVYRITGFVIVKVIDSETKKALSFHVRNLWLLPFQEKA